jgi:hypothetical protein
VEPASRQTRMCRAAGRPPLATAGATGEVRAPATTRGSGAPARPGFGAGFLRLGNRSVPRCAFPHPNTVPVVVMHVAGLACDPDTALSLRLVTSLAFERTDAGLLQPHGVERIDTGDLGVELRSGKFVERLEGAPRVRIPAAISRAGQASDPSQLTLQQARGLAGRRSDGRPWHCDVGRGCRDERRRTGASWSFAALVCGAAGLCSTADAIFSAASSFAICKWAKSAKRPLG